MSETMSKTVGDNWRDLYRIGGIAIYIIARRRRTVKE